MKLKKKSKLEIAMKNIELPEGDIEEVELKVNYKNSTFKATAKYKDKNTEIYEGQYGKTMLKTTIYNNAAESDADLEDRILFYYVHKGMTQEEIEETTGVSQSKIARILRSYGYIRGKKQDSDYDFLYIVDLED